MSSTKSSTRAKFGNRKQKQNRWIHFYFICVWPPSARSSTTCSYKNIANALSRRAEIPTHKLKKKIVVKQYRIHQTSKYLLTFTYQNEANKNNTIECHYRITNNNKYIVIYVFFLLLPVVKLALWFSRTLLHDRFGSLFYTFTNFFFSPPKRI